MDLTVTVEHKIKESEKIRQILDFVREPKKLWNIKVTGMPFVISALGMVPKGLGKRLGEREIRGRFEATQNTALLK